MYETCYNFTINNCEGRFSFTLKFVVYGIIIKNIVLGYWLY